MTRFSIFAGMLMAGLVLPSFAFAATLSLSPSQSSVSSGKTVSVTVLVSSSDQAMNAASGIITFPNDKLEVVSVSKVNSVATLWVQDPSFSNSAGTVSFEGVVLNPGFTGSGGKFLTITFRARSLGSARLSFLSASVLANDGQGSEILTSSNGATITVQESVSTPAPQVTTSAVTITSATHPSQNKWYVSDSPRFVWTLPQGALEVRTLIGENPNSTPNVSYAPAISSKAVEDLPDGTYYFSLQVRTQDGWGSVTRYKVNIDTAPPNPFSVSILPLDSQKGVQAQFSTTDNLSGLDHYNLLVNEVLRSTVTEGEAGGVVTVPPTAAGKSVLTVVAYDKAGNSVSSEGVEYVALGEATIDIATKPYDLTLVLLLVAGFILVVGGMYAIWFVLSHRKHKTRHTGSTSRILHAELVDIYKALKEEVEHLETEGSARELTSEEKRVLKRLTKLVEKAKEAVAEESSL